MNNPIRMFMGTAVTVVLISATAVLSSNPVYHTIPPGTGVLKFSFSHGGARSCRQRTEKELAKLPPNMKRKEICDRRRQPVYVELEIDGKMAVSALLPPSGLAGDGPSRIYERFPLRAGEHDIAVRLRDTNRTDGFDYTAERRLSITAEQSRAIDFRAENGGFTFN